MAVGPEYFGKDLEAMSFATNYHNWILAEFLPYLGKSVAEVGAGTGNFSTLLLKTDISKLAAFEPSLNMFPSLNSAVTSDSRASAFNGYFDGLEYSEEFDSILYVNVLEHIEDDAAEVVRAYTALKPGGHLLIFVPALSWLYGKVDREVGHFRRYHKQQLHALSAGAGFDCVKLHYFDMVGILPWYINFVMLKRSLSGSSISLYDRLVIPLMRVVEGIVTPPIGKNLLLVARKPMTVDSRTHQPAAPLKMK